MTAPHLSEYENWPGPGTTPAGRRPTPYLLSLLASVYECAVHDLLDLADYEHMPPADRLIIDKTTPGDVGGPPGAPSHRLMMSHGGGQELRRPHPLCSASIRRGACGSCPAN